MTRRKVGYGVTPRLGVPRESSAWYHEWALQVGSRIRRVRKMRGLSQGALGFELEMADGYGLSAGTISQIERGWPSVPFLAYLKIADVLEVPAWLLLGPEQLDLELMFERLRAAAADP